MRGEADKAQDKGPGLKSWAEEPSAGCPADRRTMGLPDLPDFNDAILEQIALGPRRELTLVAQLLPRLNGAIRTPAIAVRFGGIVNFAEVKAFFAVPHYEHSEIGSIHYASQQRSKLGQLYIELLYERVDASIIIECGSLSIT